MHGKGRGGMGGRKLSNSTAEDVGRGGGERGKGRQIAQQQDRQKLGVGEGRGGAKHGGQLYTT